MGPAHDLDALIGEIRREAARRRAAPDFPVEEEAGLSVEMDALGPSGGGADLAAVTAALRAVGPGATAAEVAALTGSAVSALAVRLTELERGRNPAVVPAPIAGPAPVAGAAGERSEVAAAPASAEQQSRWMEELTELVALSRSNGGRILLAGPGSGFWVERLQAAGADAYGLDPSVPRYGDHGPVRAGPLGQHLRSVAEDALAFIVVVGTLQAGEAEGLVALAGELVRVATAVVVCGESPWAWRARLGDARADTSPERPVGPEAWLAALTAAGSLATARYGPDGRDFVVRAARSRPAKAAGPQRDGPATP
ncbi:MAG: hypothetical protein M0Z30_19125 [Actinomycetota bacterium]|nr:hypothetical protein [Actinomycetota bacterium]